MVAASARERWPASRVQTIPIPSGHIPTATHRAQATPRGKTAVTHPPILAPEGSSAPYAPFVHGHADERAAASRQDRSQAGDRAVGERQLLAGHRGAVGTGARPPSALITETLPDRGQRDRPGSEGEAERSFPGTGAAPESPTPSPTMHAPRLASERSAPRPRAAAQLPPGAAWNVALKGKTRRP